MYTKVGRSTCISESMSDSSEIGDLRGGGVFDLIF